MHDTIAEGMQCIGAGDAAFKTRPSQVHHSGVEVGLARPIRKAVLQKEDQHTNLNSVATVSSTVRGIQSLGLQRKVWHCLGALWNTTHWLLNTGKTPPSLLVKFFFFFLRLCFLEAT